MNYLVKLKATGHVDARCDKEYEAVKVDGGYEIKLPNVTNITTKASEDRIIFEPDSNILWVQQRGPSSS